jgi:hypothetical protein
LHLALLFFFRLFCGTVFLLKFAIKRSTFHVFRCINAEGITEALVLFCTTGILLLHSCSCGFALIPPFPHQLMSLTLFLKAIFNVPFWYLVLFHFLAQLEQPILQLSFLFMAFEICASLLLRGQRDGIVPLARPIHVAIPHVSVSGSADMTTIRLHVPRCRRSADRR